MFCIDKEVKNFLKRSQTRNTGDVIRRDLRLVAVYATRSMKKDPTGNLTSSTKITAMEAESYINLETLARIYLHPINHVVWELVLERNCLILIRITGFTIALTFVQWETFQRISGRIYQMIYTVSYVLSRLDATSLLVMKKENGMEATCLHLIGLDALLKL